MTRVRVASFSVSLEGCGARPDRGLDRPLGRGGEGRFNGLELPARGCSARESRPGEAATDILLARSAAA